MLRLHFNRLDPVSAERVEFYLYIYLDVQVITITRSENTEPQKIEHYNTTHKNY